MPQVLDEFSGDPIRIQGSRTSRPESNRDVVLRCSTLHCTALHCTTLHYTTLHYTTLHYTTLHYTTLHYTTLHNTALRCAALRCAALRCAALRCAALRCASLRCMKYLTFDAGRRRALGRQPVHGQHVRDLVAHLDAGRGGAGLARTSGISAREAAHHAASR